MADLFEKAEGEFIYNEKTDIFFINDNVCFV